MRNSLGLSAGLLAIVAVALRLTGPGAPEASQEDRSRDRGQPADHQPAPSDSTGKTTDLEGPWLATRYFYGDRTVQQPGYELNPAITATALNCYGGVTVKPDCAVNEVGLRDYFGIPHEKPEEISFLIGTIPDPLHTRLSLVTDLSISAVQRAAADQGWRFATQWLPWSDTIDPTEKDPAKRREERAAVRDQEREPGLMVFRRQVECNSLNRGDCSFSSRVLMVFLVGETPTAGVNPVQFQAARAYIRAISRPGRLGIIGPMFSGSFDSLQRLVSVPRGDAGIPMMYDVVSGTTTDPSGARAFDSLPGVTFWSSGSARTFNWALNAIHVSPEDAAVLAEDESEYGEGPQAGIRTFHFPRDISHLRNAYREASTASAKGAPLPDLEFSLKDNDVGEDSIPDFSHAQTPLEQNAVLESIADTIQRQRIRVVEIVATNVLDMLFVSRVLKRRCADTRIVLADADLLFVEAAQTDSLTGVLALSPFPLFMESNEWYQRRKNQPWSFSNTLSQGIYVASRALLNGQPTAPDGTTPTWLLTLDRNGFQPVALNGRSEDAAVPAVPKASPAWILTASTVGLLCLTFGGWVLKLNRSLKPSFADMFAVERIMPVPGRLDAWRILYISFCALTLAGLEWVIGVPVVFAGAASPLQVILFALSLLSCLMVTAFSLRCFASLRPPSVFAVCLLLPLVLVGGLWAWFSRTGDEKAVFFSLRAAELHLGSSPAIPVLACLAIVLAFGLVHLARLHSVAAERPAVMVRPEEIPGTLQRQIRRFCRELNTCLASPYGVRGWEQARILLAVAGLFLLSRADIKLRAIDGTGFDVLSIGLTVVGVVALALTAWQVQTLWRSLHGLLATLDVLPIAARFTRPDHSSSERPIWVRRLNLQSLPIHAGALLVLHDLALKLPSLAAAGGWAERGEQYKRHLKKLFDAKSRAEVLKLRRKMRAIARSVGGDLYRFADERWKCTSLAVGPSEAAGEEKAQDNRTAGLITINGDPKNPLHLAETFIALHYSPFLLYCVRQIRNLIVFLSIGFLLLVVALNGYSHQAPQFIGRFLFLFFIGISWIVLRSIVGIERDPILSRIAGTTPGKVGAEGWLKLASYGALPVFSLLASQFPAISSFLYSWIAPTLEAFR